jgi:hypothetical protein
VACARDEEEGSFTHLGLLVASDEAVATLEHQEPFAMLVVDVRGGPPSTAGVSWISSNAPPVSAAPAMNRHSGTFICPPADTFAQRPGVPHHCARHQPSVTLVQPRRAGGCPAAVGRPGEVIAVRLRGQQSNTALVLITVVIIVVLLVAGYVLLIAPR